MFIYMLLLKYGLVHEIMEYSFPFPSKLIFNGMDMYAHLMKHTTTNILQVYLVSRYVSIKFLKLYSFLEFLNMPSL